MDPSDHPERRARQRRIGERRNVDHPVFLDTRRPAERRAAERRRAGRATPA